MDGSGKLLSSSQILNELGYDYYSFIEEPSEPEYSDMTFAELVPELDASTEVVKNIINKRIYKHQIETYNKLKEGKNVILISGTGSGKTEAWVFYAIKNKLKVLALYPTLVLSQDQIVRLKNYYSAAGLKNAVIEISGSTRRKAIFASLERRLLDVKVVVTNPAFLLAELKRIATSTFRSRSKPILWDFLSDVDMIVVDELDYYGSRRATLLLALIEIIVKFISSKKPQIVVLTATLGNPDTLKDYLTKINKRETVIIRGRAFRVKNHVYLILGKNLEKVWKSLQKKKEEILSKAPEIAPLLRDFDSFRENAPILLDIFDKYKIRIPEFTFDITEILAEYIKAKEDYVTVVFTPSIRVASKLARRLKSRLRKLGFTDAKADLLVALHHHLIPPSQRREIEEYARKGIVKVIFTVRTLLQGIDIGTIARIIHYGLPEDVREYKQREGRKGRRREMPFSESIIIPLSQWDRMLAGLGRKGLEEYTSLPLENVYINPYNKCVLLFKALYKLHSRPRHLTKEEVELLKALGLVEEATSPSGHSYLRITDEGRRVWRNLNFYDYGPPFSIHRTLVTGGKEENIEGEVSWRDLIEKYQPGSLDYSIDAVVVGVERNKIREMPLEEAIRRVYFIRQAAEVYHTIKLSWREKPDLLEDFESGRLTSTISFYIKIPEEGFGRMTEWPVAVRWLLESSKPKIIKYLNNILVTYESRPIDIESRLRGSYHDFTYGYIYELDPEEDLTNIRVGLAFLTLALRLSDYRVSINELGYNVEAFPRKTLILWERNCCGIIESIKWNKIREFIDNFKPCKICELLLWAVDEEAALTVASRKLGWDDIKEYARRVLDYIEGVMALRLKRLGEIRIPRPSEKLKLLSVDIEPLTPDVHDVCYLVTLFDGENYNNIIVASRDKNKLCKNLKNNNINCIEKFNEIIMKYIDKGYKILLYGQEDLLRAIADKSIVLKLLLENLVKNGLLVDVHKMAVNALGVDIAPVEKLEDYLGIKRKTSILDLRDAYYEAIIRRDLERFAEVASEYGRHNAYAVYLVYLVLKQLGGAPSNRDDS